MLGMGPLLGLALHNSWDRVAVQFACVREMGAREACELHLWRKPGHQLVVLAFLFVDISKLVKCFCWDANDVNRAVFMLTNSLLASVGYFMHVLAVDS